MELKTVRSSEYIYSMVRKEYLPKLCLQNAVCSPVKTMKDPSLGKQKVKHYIPHKMAFFALIFFYTLIPVGICCDFKVDLSYSSHVGEENCKHCIPYLFFKSNAFNLMHFN